MVFCLVSPPPPPQAPLPAASPSFFRAPLPQPQQFNIPRNLPQPGPLPTPAPISQPSGFGFVGGRQPTSEYIPQ